MTQENTPVSSGNLGSEIETRPFSRPSFERFTFSEAKINLEVSCVPQDRLTSDPNPPFAGYLARLNAVGFDFTDGPIDVICVSGAAASTSDWTNIVGGNWSAADNWSSGVPNAVGLPACLWRRRKQSA